MDFRVFFWRFGGWDVGLQLGMGNLARKSKVGVSSGLILEPNVGLGLGLILEPNAGSGQA
jgi:hypothetical protein